jgi:hypothetical protein
MHEWRSRRRAQGSLSNDMKKTQTVNKSRLLVGLYLLCAGCAVIDFEPLPRESQPCSTHPQLASIRSLTVVPFSDSDKSINEDLVMPDGRQIPLYTYPIAADGEFIAKLLERELRTQTRFSIVEWPGSEPGLKRGVEKARLVGRRMGVEAVLVGNVARYRAVSQLSTEEPDLIHNYLGEVAFSVDVIQTRGGGQVLFHCEKMGNSLNFLESSISVNSYQPLPEIAGILDPALHGTTAEERTSYLAKELAKETAQALASISWSPPQQPPAGGPGISPPPIY